MTAPLFHPIIHHMTAEAQNRQQKVQVPIPKMQLYMVMGDRLNKGKLYLSARSRQKKGASGPWQDGRALALGGGWAIRVLSFSL